MQETSFGCAWREIFAFVKLVSSPARFLVSNCQKAKENEMSRKITITYLQFYLAVMGTSFTAAVLGYVGGMLSVLLK